MRRKAEILASGSARNSAGRRLDFALPPMQTHFVEKFVGPLVYRDVCLSRRREAAPLVSRQAHVTDAKIMFRDIIKFVIITATIVLLNT